MKKIFLFLILFLSGSIVKASGLELVNITPEYDQEQNLLIKEPENGYNFNLAFLWFDQEVIYKATIKNSEDYKIIIEDVNLNNPNSETLSFSYEGLDNNYVINPGEEKEVTLKLKTLSRITKSINEEYNFKVKYLVDSPESINPNTGTGKIIVTFAILALSFLLCIILYKKYHSKAFMVLLVGISTIAVTVIAKEEKTLSITGNVDYKAAYSVVVDPNGGIYDGKTTETSVLLVDGEIYSVLPVTKENHDFQGWEINPNTKEMNNEEITVDENISLKALWDEEYYVLTIDTDGGTYKGISGIIHNSYRPNEDIELANAEKTGYEFNHWEDEDGNVVTSPLRITKDTTIYAKYEDKYLNVTINPNGGKFNGSEEIYTTSVKYNSTIDISDISRDEYTFVGWLKNNNIVIDSDEITITEDTTLEARWESIYKYYITVNPNGGTYKGNTGVVVETVFGGNSYTLVDPQREGYVFARWVYENGDPVENTTFDVYEDISVKAEWEEIICKIDNTFYSSIMKAEAAAKTGDTIVLLKDTRETVTNSKKVTLDLNNHKVTGSLTNTSAGDITIINGIIENPDGIAVTNDGILTIGIDDLKDDGTSNIIRDNVQIIGTTVGLKQNNIFYYYDGFIEGDIALEGGYDGSPYYRNTFDDTIVHYFPFVDHNHEKDCQHVELEASDKAVSKTSVHGDIYYYNLQDNINTSARTGYAMYAVRDFNAEYSLSIPENANISFDIVGYNVNIGDTTTNNGTFTIKDSSDNIGSLSVTGTITNNNKLTIKDVKITITTPNNLINNNKTLDIKNSTLISQAGYTVNLGTEGTLSIDATTTLKGNSYTIYNPTNSNLVLSKGTVGGINNYGTVELKESISVQTGASYIYNQSSAKLLMNGGTINSTAQYAIYNNNATVEIKNGDIVINSSANKAYAIEGKGTTTMNGGTITTQNKTQGAVHLGSDMNFIMNNGTITTVNSGVYGEGGLFTMNGGTINANGTGVHYYSSGTIQINGGEINSNGTAVYLCTYPSGILNVTGGKIHGNTTGIGTSNYYAYSASGTATITGGEISGGTYGIDARSGIINIGSDDEVLSTTTPVITGGTYGVYISHGSTPLNANFYDGLLKGKTGSYYGEFTLTPQKTQIFTETEEEYIKSYLIEAEYFLRIGDIEYNSFNDAYAAATDDDTIYLIKDTRNTSSLPTIEAERTIKFDLNGHSLQIASTIINNGTFEILDSSDEGTGIITSTVSGSYFMNNTGTVNLNGGSLSSSTGYIYNKGTINLDGSNLNFKTQYVIYDDNATLNINSGSITINSGENKAYAVYGKGTTTMNGGTITTQNKTQGAIYLGGNMSFILNNGEIYASGSSVYGEGGAFTMNGGKMTSAGTGVHFYSGATININGGEIYSNGTAVYLCTYPAGILNITGGKIHGDNTGVGMSNYYAYSASGTATITGGEISGGTYGIDTSSGVLNIGLDDETISTTTPVITGGTYGVNIKYGSTPLHPNFYDGILKGKTAGFNGEFALIPEKTRIHTETEEEYLISYLVAADNFLRVGTEEFNSFTDAYNAITDEGTIELLASVNYKTPLPTIENTKSVTLDLQGHTLNITSTWYNNGTLTIMDSSDGKTGILQSSASGVNFMNNTGTVNLNGGTITSSTAYIYNKGLINLDGSDLNFRTIYAISNDNANVVIDSGSITINSGENKAYAITGKGTTTMNGGTITTQNKTQGAIYLGGNMSFILNNGEINASGSSVYGEGGTFTMNGGKMTSAGTGVHFYSGATININGGEIYSNGTAVYLCTYPAGILNITGGKIHGDNTGVGMSNYYAYSASGTATITGGEISGGTYGIDARSGTLNLGVDDGDISITKPSIIGGTYGVYISHGSTPLTVNFYDGILKGKTDNYFGVIDNTAEHTIIKEDTETIDEELYQTAYLIQQVDFIKNGDTLYSNMKDAIDEANSGDILELINDGQNFEPITIPADKELTIDFKTYSILTSKPVINNGTLTITSDPDSDEDHIEFAGTDYLITNNASGTLTIENIYFNAPYIVKNNENGTLTIKNTKMISSNTAVNNLGAMSIEDSNITGSTYAVYISTTADNSIKSSSLSSPSNVIYKNSSSKTIVEGSTITGYVTNNNASGIMNLKNTNISVTTSGKDNQTITNAGSMTLDKVMVEHTTSNYNTSGSYTNRGIKNTGTLVIENTSKVKVVYLTSQRGLNTIGILNQGNLEVSNSDIELSGNNKSNSYVSYGIYNDSGTSVVKTGTIDVKGATTYGIYINSGEVVFGVPEPTDSINYGGEFADVSTTNPYIESVGTNQGIGVKNNNSRFKYYDGKILGSTSAKPELATDIEYLYEAIDYTDSETGYKYCILEWMRNSGGN
ncbi:MAG: InlB B-repeat-containing protein [Bacilli bacterium]|nr:InlB B-repeat-containing protein [Bacilli bacterium]